MEGSAIKHYILLSEEELIDLGKGNTIEVPMKSGEILYVMCAERFAEMMEESEEPADGSTGSA